MSPERKRKVLKNRIKSGDIVVAPGVFEMISALLVEKIGHHTIYISGYGTVASYLGLPDAGLASFSEMLQRISQITEVTSCAVIADADTGYGGLLNLQHTVKGYEKVGVSAIQLEDQEFPKKCGHTKGKSVIKVEDMLDKIKVAVDTRNDDNLLVVARTDSRADSGLSEAIDRVNAYHEVGADVLFVEAPESIDELAYVAAQANGPVLANMVEGGRSPFLSAEELDRLGYSVAIFPGSGFLAATQAMQEVYTYLIENGTTTGCKQNVYPIDMMHELTGFENIWKFEEKWSKKCR